MPSAFGCAACAGSGSDIYVRVHAVVADDRLKRLAISWEFTETVVRVLMHEYDLNKDGRLDPTEKQALETFFSKKLADSGYFTTLIINSRTVTGAVYDNLRLTIDSSTPGFQYEIPLNHAIADGLDLTIQFLDPDARFNYYYRHDSVTWNRPQGYSLIHNAFVFPKKLAVRIQDAEPDISSLKASAAAKAPVLEKGSAAVY
ncbi:MAG: DUF1007 family protein [Desulfotignum sp.]|nr:DUF1007 family protein [Desulfotignum sp.]